MAELLVLGFLGWAGYALYKEGKLGFPRSMIQGL